MSNLKMIGLFADVSNLYYCISRRFPNQKLDYQKYLELAAGDDTVYRAFAYGIQLKDEATKFITCLKHYGFEAKYKNPRLSNQKEYKRTSWNVGIGMDVVRIIDKLDVVVIGSADAELAPLVELIKERGRRCHILACGISKELKTVADQYTEINESILKSATEPENAVAAVA
jgi:uncharacterized LabA/DUF88 family protein